MGSTGASNNRHGSVQVVGTPRDFLDAVEKRFGLITCDLAATHDNKVCDNYISPEENSLVASWPTLGLNWLNPEFADIKPWAIKCSVESSMGGAKILMLVPASIDSKWFAEYVYPFALIVPVRGRIKFVGHTNSFPKPLMLCVYGYGVNGMAKPWDWRNE